MKITLTFKKENQVIETIEITQFPFSIGRSKDNDLVIDEPHISRHHVVLDLREKNLVVINHSTPEKVTIDGKGIEEQEVTCPITFEIDPFSFTLEVPVKATEVLPHKDEGEPEEEFPLTIEEDEEREISEVTKISKKQPKAKIIVIQGTSPHESYDIMGQEIVIGRDEECDIIIEDAKASREHARISLKNNIYIIQDADSANGTRVNSKPVEAELELTSGDQIQIGDTILQFALFDENVYALSPVGTAPELSADATQTGIMSPDQAPGQSPSWQPGIPSYFRRRSFQGFYAQYKKIIWASAGLLLLLLTFWTLTPPSEPERETAQQRRVRTEDKEAEDELAKLLEDDRKYVLAKMKEAKDLIKNRKYREARIALQEIFTIAPGYKKARALEATIRYVLDQQRAQERQQKAKLEEQRLNEEIKYHLAIALDYFNRQNWDKAIEQYDKILELNPEHQQAQKRRSIAQQKVTQADESERATIAASKKRNRRAERLLAKGSQLSQQGKLKAALNTWRKILKMEGIHPEYYSKADKFIQFTKGKLQEKYLPLITQANALIETNEYAQAKKIAESILKEFPSHAEAKQLVRKIDNALHQRARREYTEAIIEENVGRIDEAIKRFKWIVREIPSSDEYHRKAKNKLKKYE